jgi:hypothetical protein
VACSDNSSGRQALLRLSFPNFIVETPTSAALFTPVQERFLQFHLGILLAHRSRALVALISVMDYSVENDGLQRNPVSLVRAT